MLDEWIAQRIEVETRKTDLQGADLSHAVNLTCGQIELARIDRDTKLPGNIKIAWVSDDAYECEEHAGKNSR
ncbi:MAG: hypothetical protein HZA02_09940 [Nitrospinae bacterium]|nr:hypothetical protein [Nitrospinota bacterium]